VRLENSFVVPASPDETWALLNDVPRVVPNMPGAELKEVVGENAWKATMHVKLGPIALQFATDVERQLSDAQARRTMLGIRAREMRNRGGATASIESSLEPDGAGTRVLIVTELQMQGAVAQYGRGVVPDVANQLVTCFAENLASELRSSSAGAGAGEDGDGDPEAEPPTPGASAASRTTPVEPIGGVRLLLRALVAPLLRLFRRSAKRG